MRVEGSTLAALSDCWENKAVIRDWESVGAYLFFNGENGTPRRR